MKGDREPDLIDAMLAIIRHPSIDAETGREAATVISIDASFNAGVTSRKKLGIEKDDMFDLLDFAEKVLGEARAIAGAILSITMYGARMIVVRRKSALADSRRWWIYVTK